LLIDDLVGFKSILKDEPEADDDVAMNVGFHLTLNGGWHLGGSYTRIEPFVYTHWQRLNTYDQRGISLGHPMGPNADELMFKIRKWFPWRSWVEVRYGAYRKGLNPVNSAGRETVNAGGNLLWGNAGIGLMMFQNADLQRFETVEAEIQTEPLRGLTLSLRAYKRLVKEGERTPSLSYIDLRFRYGL
jgi:hypothetical protein